jgi:hypothetical protein
MIITLPFGVCTTGGIPDNAMRAVSCDSKYFSYIPYPDPTCDPSFTEDVNLATDPVELNCPVLFSPGVPLQVLCIADSGTPDVVYPPWA